MANNNGVDGSVIINIEADSEDFEKQISNLDGIIQHAFGNLLSDAVRKAIGSTQELATEVYSTGVSFESAFAGVKKTVDETATTTYDDLNNSLREMAKNMPAAYEEIAGVAEAAGQLGIATDNITDFTKVMVDLGNSTNLSAEMAASELAKFANVTKMSADDYDRLGSAIVDLGNNMATTEQDIVNMSQRLGATASVAGIAQPDILALSAALSSVGVEAEAGGTAMATFIKKMQTAVETGNKNLSKFAEVADMSEQAFAELFQKDGAKAIDAFIKGLHRIDEEGGSALTTIQDMGFKEVRLSNAILALANNGDILTNALRISNDAWAENTALTEEAEKRYETTESKMQMLQNTVRDFYYELSQSIGGQLGGFLDLEKIGDILERVKEKVEQGNLGETLGKIGEKLLELGEAAADFAIDEGLPALLNFLEWISTHGDEIITVLELIAAKFVADKAGDYAGAIANVVTQFQALGGATAAATTTEATGAALGTTATTAASAASAVNAFVLAVEAAIIVGNYLADKIDAAGDELVENTQYMNDFTDATNETWEAYVRLTNEFQTNPIGAGNEAAANLEADKKTLESYQTELAETQARIAELNDMRENDNPNFLINGYDEELIALQTKADELQRNIDAYTVLTAVEENYAAFAGEQVKTWQEQLKDVETAHRQGLLDDTAYWRRRKEILEKNRHMEDHEWQVMYDEVAQHYRDLGKTEEKAQASLEDELAELEKQYQLDQVNGTADEKAYWAKRKAILEAHRNEEDEEWRKMYIDVQEHYESLTEAEKREQEKADAAAKREQEKAQREREKRQKEYASAIDDIYTNAQRDAKKELAAVRKAYDELANEYEKGYQQILSDRDAYKQKLMGGSIFEVITKTDEETGEKVTEYTIHDIKDRLKKQTEYAEYIKALRDRNLSEGLLAELESMDTEQGAIFAKQLVDMSDKDFNEINDLYSQLDEKTTALANERYQKDLDDLQNNYISQVQELFSGLSQDLKDMGLDIAPSIIGSIVTGFDDGSENIKEGIDGLFDTVESQINSDLADLSDNITAALKEQGYGDALIDSILTSIDSRKQEVENAVKDILTSTDLDVEIQTDMQARSATASASGYSAAKADANANTQTTDTTTKAAGSEQTVKVVLQLTEQGKGIIAEIVNAENKKKEIEVNG